MKYILIFIITSLFTGCNDDDSNKQTTLATILSNGWTGCEYIVQFENQEYHFAENLPQDFQMDDMSVTITYATTNRTQNCGFSGALSIINIIEITEN